jgi:hypothetical protein
VRGTPPLTPPLTYTNTRLRPTSTRLRAIPRRFYPARRKPLGRYGGKCCHNLFHVGPDPATYCRHLQPQDLHQGTQGCLLNQASLLPGSDQQARLGRICLCIECVQKYMHPFITMLMTASFSIMGRVGSRQERNNFKALSERTKFKISSGLSSNLVLHLQVLLLLWKKSLLNDIFCPC